MKNLKFNFKNLSALLLAGTVTLTGMSLSGCSEKQDKKDDNASILSGTILEGTRVVTFADGSKEIVKVESAGFNNKHYHYTSVVSGDTFESTSSSCSQENIYRYDIISDESITSYLTTDEIINARKNGLSDKDIDQIFSRIYGQNEIAEADYSDQLVENSESDIISTQPAETAESEVISTTESQGNIQSSSDNMISVLNQYCGKWNLLQDVEATEEDNKAIDELIAEVKEKGYDIHIFDNPIFRKYMLMPYISWSGEKYTYQPQYSDDYLALCVKNLDWTRAQIVVTGNENDFLIGEYVYGAEASFHSFVTFDVEDGRPRIGFEAHSEGFEQDSYCQLSGQIGSEKCYLQIYYFLQDEGNHILVPVSENEVYEIYKLIASGINQNGIDNFNLWQFIRDNKDYFVATFGDKLGEKIAQDNPKVLG